MRKESLPLLRTAALATTLSSFAALFAGPMRAQVVIAPATPQIGSSNPVTADPPVTRPFTRPCVVQLFKNFAFENFNLQSFNYTPPAGCHGPWAKVVFTADFTVSAGTQFDRTATFYLGGASIYYGSTAEPRSALSPSWHVERDVTDLTALFKSAQTGEANVGNFVGESGGVNYNGIIYANAALEFYPASILDPAPKTPDIVIPVNGTGGDAGTLNTTTDQIAQTLNLPTNVESVYFDVFSQSQSGDEFWYLCVPNDATATLQSCGNTAFRETEITIDGKPAGVAPVYPWIYTGGIDFYMWEPIPGVQTLDFKPYRVNLTPFAGLLSDGSQHTIAVNVFNASSYFLATANLLVYTDPGTKRVTGGILSNTLSASPSPVVNENFTANGGSVSVASSRDFAIQGYVDTSHGRVETTVKQNVNFLSKQQFDIQSTLYSQNAEQTSTVDSQTTTREGILVTTKEAHFSYPLTISYSDTVNTDGSQDVTTKVNQQYLVNTSEGLEGFTLYKDSVSNQVQAQDTQVYTASGNFVGPTDSKTTQTYNANDSLGRCYSRTLTATAQALTSVVDGKGCRR